MTDIDAKLEKLNQDYCGKQIKHCTFLGRTLNFDYGKIAFCCNFTIDKMPVICDIASLENKSLKYIFTNKLIDTIRCNQAGKGLCTGCKHLREMEFEGLNDQTLRLSSITWNNFRRCNSGCVYCFQDQAEPTKPYLAYELAEQLYTQGLVGKNALLLFGGGEPSMLPNLKNYLDFGYRHHMEQLLNTSAIRYSQELYDGLTKGVTVQISPDSGTRETYRRIKRRDRFEAVWNTIGRYCDFPDAVRVKYIVFSWNSSKEDLDGFLEECKKAGVKNVEISAERNVAISDRNRVFEDKAQNLYWSFGKKEEEACLYLINKCLESGFAVGFSCGNFSQSLENRILSKFAVAFNARVGTPDTAVYIFGMGQNGKSLYDRLKEHIPFKGFLVSDTVRNTDGYGTLKCYHTSDIPKDAHIILSNTKYVPILAELRKEGFFNIDVFHV